MVVDADGGCRLVLTPEAQLQPTLAERFRRGLPLLASTQISRPDRGSPRLCRASTPQYALEAHSTVAMTEHPAAGQETSVRRILWQRDGATSPSRYFAPGFSPPPRGGRCPGIIAVSGSSPAARAGQPASRPARAAGVDQQRLAGYADPGSTGYDPITSRRGTAPKTLRQPAR